MDLEIPSPLIIYYLFYVKFRLVTNMELPKRKNIRLKDYNYFQTGAYFVTICVKDRKPILSDVAVGASIARPYDKQGDTANKRCYY